MTDIERRESKTVTISQRTLWILMTIIIVLVSTFALGGAYLYSQTVKYQCYLTNRQEFIEQHKEVQYVLAGETFCYSPEGHMIQMAKYKGKGMYKVKP